MKTQLTIAKICAVSGLIVLALDNGSILAQSRRPADTTPPTTTGPGIPSGAPSWVIIGISKPTNGYRLSPPAYWRSGHYRLGFPLMAATKPLFKRPTCLSFRRALSPTVRYRPS